MLRASLARYTGDSPSALRFRYGPVGKPQLDGPLGGTISFNLAHSHHLALLAVARGTHVGVDIERVSDADDVAISRGFFAPAEQRALAELPPAQRRAAFYRCWVCKEAFVKARGDGLALDRFAVRVNPAAPATLLHVDNNPDEAVRWRLTTITTEEGFVAALCIGYVTVSDGPHPPNPLSLSGHIVTHIFFTAVQCGVSAPPAGD